MSNRELELENCLRQIAKDAEYGLMCNREIETLKGIQNMAKRHVTGRYSRDELRKKEGE